MRSLLAVLLLLLATACGSTGTQQSDLTVLAASSLTDVFEDAGAAYEKARPGTEVQFSFAGSQELAAQVRQGAPADVLVTADSRTMDGLGNETRKPAVIATNRLAIVAPKGNPHHIDGLEDLADSGLKVVLAAPEVPAGAYSREVLEDQRIDVEPVSEESNVRGVLSKVELGEADAGIVYATDAKTSDGVATIAIPTSQNAVAEYPAAALREAKPEAGDFVAWLHGAKAQRLLHEAGFGRP